MSRRYWAGVMSFSLVVSVAAGIFTWTTLRQKMSVDVPLTKIAPNAPAVSEDSPAVENLNTVASSQEVVPPAVTSAASPNLALPNTASPIASSPSSASPELGEDSADAGVRNILFTYRQASAKQVYIVGSFNEWVRKPMEKNDKGLWQISLKLKPGFYEYKFVVDDRKIKDPNNKLFTPAGNSILKVKPLS